MEGSLMPRTKRSEPIERLVAMPLAEIAKVLGITTMRVHQIEKEALAKIRAEFERAAQFTPCREDFYYSYDVAGVALSRAAREGWLWYIKLVDCDLSDGELARSWRANV